MTIEEWYDETITIDRQWHVMKTEEAFYSEASQSGSVRKPLQNQTGMPGVWNDSQPSYNNSYRQGGYQNRGQISGSVTVPHQDNRLGQKDSNAMEVDRIHRSADLLLNITNARS